MGSHVNAMFRLRCRSSAPLGVSHEMQALMQDKRHTSYFGKSCDSHVTIHIYMCSVLDGARGKLGL